MYKHRYTKHKSSTCGDEQEKVMRFTQTQGKAELKHGYG